MSERFCMECLHEGRYHDEACSRGREEREALEELRAIAAAVRAENDEDVSLLRAPGKEAT